MPCDLISAEAGSPESLKVSVIIKTFNEERHIERAVRSALDAVAAVGGEVIVADSHSTDRTVELALRWPVRVVQLKNPSERRCGIGPQLGYIHARGSYVCIMDGDMRMHPGFLAAACSFLDRNARAAGVGGRVVEQNTTSLEYVARAERGGHHYQPGEVDRLDGGGLYRKAALDAAGYMSDRNLHSYEEYDLALRLRMKGWTLWRIDQDACDHWGHDVPPYRLLRRRWSSGYVRGCGELLRVALEQGRLRQVLREIREYRVYGVAALWMVGSLLSLIAALVVSSVSWWVPMAAWISLPLLILGQKRSLSKATYAVAGWFFAVGGLVVGFGGKRVRTDQVPEAEVRIGPAMSGDES